MTSQNLIRNFAIIAHVDHGKSTLADRLLEVTKTVSKDKLIEQFLDQNPISRERGITIKLAPVRMRYVFPIDNSEYILNLIDTPGHMDFAYEVSRTLAACEGVILLIDASQGIQAQTVAHFNAARKENLKIIPVINKIDLPTAQTEKVVNDLEEIFLFRKDEMFFVSAKTGQNINQVLNAVVEKIPFPKGDVNKPFRALIFDASFDKHRGVIVFIRVVDGRIKKGEKIQFMQNNQTAFVIETGYFSPYLVTSSELSAGEIGYIVTGIKDLRKTRVGDTIVLSEQWSKHKDEIIPLPGYKTPKPMVFFGIYPKESSDFPLLKEALQKLSLNDSAITIDEEYSTFLGSGFRIGFLGLLHAQIVKDRLQREAKLDLLLTMPRVMYKKNNNAEYEEPYIDLTIYSPSSFLGDLMSLCQRRKAQLVDILYFSDKVSMKYTMPYAVFIKGFASEVKTVSSGFASVDYEIKEYKKADIVPLEIFINDEPIDVLSDFVYSEDAVFEGRRKAEKLKELLPRKQFKQVIQAKVFGSILSRTEIPPFRKDVLAKMSGGDRTRKDKLLDKQKKGKSRLFFHGRVELSQDALFSMLSDWQNA